MIRFLLDEHVNPAIQRQLRRLNSQIDVLRVGEAEAPPKGMLDREILVWLEQRNYILVTDVGELSEANGSIHSPFLLIVFEKIGKITQVATFEDVPAISRWLYLSVVNTLLFNWSLLNFTINEGDLQNG